MTRPLDPLTKADRMIRHCPSCGGWVWRGRACGACGRKPHTKPAKPHPANGLPDDGIIDPVAVERLLNCTLEWRGATYPERLEAGRIAMTRDGGWAFCERHLRLRHDVIRSLRQEVAA